MHAHLYSEHNNDTIKKTQFLEKYTSHFICVRGSWRPNRTATYWPLHSYGHQHFFPVLLGCSTKGLGPSLSGCWFSLPHLISNSSDPQKLLNRGPEGSLCWVLAFSTISCLQTGLVSKLTDFLSSPSYIIVQRPLNLPSQLAIGICTSTVFGMALWSSSSGNNRHAVHRSLSSVCDCTVRF